MLYAIAMGQLTSNDHLFLSDTLDVLVCLRFWIKKFTHFSLSRCKRW